MSIWITLLLFLANYSVTNAQFAPPAGQFGSTAIHKDDINIINWANSCTVSLGTVNIADSVAALASAGMPENATGPAGNGSIVSLGDGGSAIVQFEHPIHNGPGADFAVFENGFSATFLELAFVEVSSDGVHFVRFPAISNTDTTTQKDAFSAIDATQVYNLAGKYQANYGTPFDLEELVSDSAVLDINAVTHIRIIDVIGSINPAYCSRDSRGHPVNDPWPTPFASGGFDLDAVAVLHQKEVGLSTVPNQLFHMHPNPLAVGQSMQIQSDIDIDHSKVRILNACGQLVWTGKAEGMRIPTYFLSTGVYYVLLKHNNQSFHHKIILY